MTEKKLYNDYLESLHVMEKKLYFYGKKVEKLRAQLANNASLERRTGAHYVPAATGYKDNEAAGHHLVGQNAYEDCYCVPSNYKDDAFTTGYSKGSAIVDQPLFPA